MRKLLLLVLLIFLVGCQPRNISVELNPGYDIIGINEEWIDEGCILNINADYAIDMEIDSSNLDITTPGEYNIVYVEEYDNVEHTCLRIVKIIDSIAPVVVLNPGIDTIVIGDIITYTDPGVLVDGEINNDVVFVSGTVDVNTVGTYVLTYTVIDEANNITVVKRIINVIE